MLLVIALGGNALLQGGQPMTEQQRVNVKIAAQALTEVASEHTIAITHGNGSQVGLLALLSVAYTPTHSMRWLCIFYI